MKNWLLSEAIGDTAGVPYEFNPERSYNEIDLKTPKGHFSDDTVCTFGIAKALMTGAPFEDTLRECCLKHLKAGYGGSFRKWIRDSKMGPYGSWGNGSAMRVSSVSLFSGDLQECAMMATDTAAITHNHPEGLKGAVVTACVGWELLHGASRKKIRETYLSQYPAYLDQSWQHLWETYGGFHVSCQKTVPAALICFLESTSYEDCLKKCIALGGDADTLCAIAGPWAYAWWKEIPQDLLERAYRDLPEWMLEINAWYNENFA